MRRAIAALLLLALAGCGGSAPSSVVPADATIYVGMDASEAERLVTTTSRADIDFEHDVAPWLGERAAYFADGPADIAGLVLETEDEDAAEAFGRKVTAAGPMRASAIIDGRLVIASTRDLLRAANAAADTGSLADSTKLDVSGEGDNAPPDLLLATEEGHAFSAGLDLYHVLPEEIPGEVAPGDGPLTARVWDERVEITGLPRVDDVAPSLADAPGASTLGFASADLGAELEDVEHRLGADLERLLAPHVGAGSVFVQPRSARLAAETSDEQALRRAAVSFARRLGPKRVDVNVGERYLQLAARDFDLLIEDGRVYLDVGVRSAGEGLGETRRYLDAERRLAGAPTVFVVRGSGYVAARREGGTLRIVSR